MKNILVYSATGVQNSPLLSLLENSGDMVFALTRNKAKSGIRETKHLSVLEADSGNEKQIIKAHEGIDIVMLNLPFFSDNNAGKYAIEAAQKAGVKLIVWNANGAIPRETSTRYKMNIRLENMERLAASDIPYVVFQPTVYLENLLLSETLKRIKENDVIEMVAPAEVPLPWMSAWDICRAMVKVIERKDLINQVLTVGGQGITGKQLARDFSQVLGRTITYQQIEMTEYINRLNKVMGKGHGEEIMGMGQQDTRAIRPANFPKFLALNAFEELNFNPMSIKDWVQQTNNNFKI